MDREAPADLVAQAKACAIAAHRRIDHRRKYNHQPYEVHLQAVAELVATVSDDPATLAAAWLHDIVEDTDVTLEQLGQSFGPAVAQLVFELTDVSRPGDGNRSARKAIDRRHLANASSRAQTVKLADLCDNALDITRGDAAFARVYLVEMGELLGVLGAGDERLQARARRILERCERRLARAGALPLERQPEQAVDQAEIDSVRRQLDAFHARDLMTPVDGRWPLFAVAAADRRLDETDTLSTVVHVLTRHDEATVVARSRIIGRITRRALEKPIGRMWLFGMLTLVELDFTARIRRYWPNGGWEALLSPGRIDAARLLLGERSRIGAAPVELLDCLQLADKGQILIQLAEQRAAWGLRTVRMAKAAIKELAALRNPLMHSQPFADEHWPQIVRLARRFDEILGEHIPAGTDVDNLPASAT